MKPIRGSKFIKFLQTCKKAATAKNKDMIKFNILHNKIVLKTPLLPAEFVALFWAVVVERVGFGIVIVLFVMLFYCCCF